MRALVFILLLPICSFGQGISFNKAYGNNDYDHGRSIVQLPDSSYVVAGATSSFGSGNTDALLMGIDKNGEFLWQRTYGEAQIEWAEDIILSSDNFLYTVGYTNDSQGNGYDALLIKTDLSGSIIWSQTYGGNDWDFAYGLIETNDGDIVIAGETYSNSNGENDAYALKVEPEFGSIVWENNFGGVGKDKFLDLTNDLEGGVWFAGSFETDTVNAYILRTDLDGTIIIDRSYKFQTTSFCTSIDRDQNGTIICVFDHWANNNSDSVQVASKKIDLNAEILWEHDHSQTDRTRHSVNVLSRPDNSSIITSNFSQGNYNATWWPFSDLGWYNSPSESTDFGDIDNDTFQKTINTNDLGMAHVGTTDSWGYGSSSIWVVKQDSLMYAPAQADDVFITTIEQDLLVKSQTFSIFPNPVGEVLILSPFLGSNDCQYLIYDSYGRMIIHEKLEGLKINVSELKTGSYVLELIINSQRSGSNKFIKQ